MMKPDDVKQLITDLNDFITRGVSTSKIEEQNFDNLMDHIYNGGKYDLSAFDNSVNGLKTKIKDAERLLNYGDTSQQDIINKSKQTIKKLEDMKKKIEGLKDKAIDKELEKATSQYDIDDIKDSEQRSIDDLNNKITRCENEDSQYRYIKNAINKECHFGEFVEVARLMKNVDDFNKLIEEYDKENSKPDDKKDNNKIEQIKLKISESREKISQDKVKEILDAADAKTIIESLNKKEMKKIGVTPIENKAKDAEKNIDKNKILTNISLDADLTKEFIARYNSGRAATAVKTINDINPDDLSVNDIASAVNLINEKQNKVNAEMKIAKKTVENKTKTFKRIDEMQNINESNKSDAELWKDYATGDQKNQLVQYSNNWSSRFKFWRSSENKNIFSAFFKAFNKNNTINVAKHEHVVAMKTKAAGLKKKLMNSFRENLKQEVTNNKVKVNQVDRDQVIGKVVEDLDKENEK